MKYILIIFIFVSFLFSQVIAINSNNSVISVDEFDKNAPRTGNNTLNLDNTNMSVNELFSNDGEVNQTDEFDKNAPRTGNNMSNPDNAKIFVNESYSNDGKVNQTDEFDENAPLKW